MFCNCLLCGCLPLLWSTVCHRCLFADVLVGVAILCALWMWRNRLFAESGLTLLNPAQRQRVSSATPWTLILEWFYFGILSFVPKVPVFLHPLRYWFPFQSRSGTFRTRGLLGQDFTTAASLHYLCQDFVSNDLLHCVLGMQLKVQHCICTSGKIFYSSLPL